LTPPLPAGSKYVGIIVENVAPFTSGGATTIALTLNGQAILNPSPAAFNAAPFAGLAGTGRFNETTAVKLLTQANTLDLTVAAADLTGGTYVFGVQYIL
jgi:hypothetical protein